MPKDPRSDPARPAGLYNAMVMPLTPYAIRGVIWYQGESNSGRPVQYRKLFPAMIRDWRQAWGEGDFPFLYYVQLANWGVHDRLKYRWPELREAQSMTLSLPKTGMAVTIDIGDASDIHPTNKQEVGYRLALAAQGHRLWARCDLFRTHLRIHDRRGRESSFALPARCTVG
jgi:sialate O-acetylesterase